jgi:hypothetical protein
MRSQVGRGSVVDACRHFGSNLFQHIRDPEVLGDHVVSDLGHAASTLGAGELRPRLEPVELPIWRSR